MKFIDWFAGIGGFRRGLELAGHKCVGFCEYDNYAVASYTAMHLITKEQAHYLKSLPLKQRQKEILKPEYRNGEWYAKDISEVKGSEIPKADIWTGGFPCQDISVAGHQKGFKGERSSLFFQFVRLLKEQEEENKPEWIILENVKNLLSVNGGWDFAKVLFALGKVGYNVGWQVFNSKDHGVPQNRERVYIVGHLRGRGRRKIFPFKGTGGENSIPVKIVGHRDGYRRNTQVFDSNGITEALSTCQGGGREHHVAVAIKVIGTTHPNRHSTGDIHNYDGLMSTCTSRDYKQPKLVAIPISKCINGKEIGIANTITAREDRGVSNRKDEGTAVCIPILTPDRPNKRQNGRRMKENGDPAFTLTGQDRHGVAIGVNMSGNVLSESNGIAHCLNANDQRKVFGAKQDRAMVAVKIKQAKDSDGIFATLQNGVTVYAIWYEKYNCYIAIRKLTPKECFRLQGWEDKYFNRASYFNSDSQLYKQAGNGVTVNVVQIIGELLNGNK